MLLYMALLENEGEKEIFEEIYNRNYNRMLWKAKSILHDVALAEDVVQDTFLRILKNKSKYFDKSGEEIAGLCVLMVKHMSFNRLRDAKYELSMDMSEGDTEQIINLQEGQPETDMLDTVIEKEEVAKIRELISLLPEGYSTVLTLFYGFQYNCSEIASMLGISRHTVEVRLSRGRRKLGKILKEKGYEKE